MQSHNFFLSNSCLNLIVVTKLVITKSKCCLSLSTTNYCGQYTFNHIGGKYTIKSSKIMESLFQSELVFWCKHAIWVRRERDTDAHIFPYCMWYCIVPDQFPPLNSKFCINLCIKLTQHSEVIHGDKLYYMCQLLNQTCSMIIVGSMCKLSTKWCSPSYIISFL